VANTTAGNWRLRKAERFMTAATRAFQASDYETAVSRAYYAYHAVIAVVEAQQGSRPSWAHRLHEYARGSSGLQALRAELVGLYAIRVVADYEERLITREQAMSALVVGRRVNETARDLV
jgi:hypothetical protein